MLKMPSMLFTLKKFRAGRRQHAMYWPILFDPEMNLIIQKIED